MTPKDDGRVVGSISADRMLEAFSALRRLPETGDDFYTAAAQLLGQTLDCPWAIILPHGRTHCERGDALGLYTTGDGTAANWASITAAAWQLITQNEYSDDHWQGVIDVAGLGTLEVRGHLCRDCEGVIRGHLLAMMPLPIADDSFTETFTALMAQHIGSTIGRRQDRGNLKTGADKFRHLIENMSQGFFVHKDTRPVFVNRAMSDMYGYDGPEDFLKIGRMDVLWPPQEIDRMQAYAMARTRDEPAPRIHECEGVKKDGTPIWVQVTAQAIRWHGETLVSGTVTDITASKEAEKAHLEAEEWFRQMIEFFPAGIALKGVDGRYKQVNRRFHELFGMSDREMIGKTVFDIISRPKAERADYLDKQILADAKPVEYPYEHIHPDGSKAYYEVTKFAVTDEGGGPVGIGLAAQDITERKRAETALAEKSAVLETILEAAPASISFRDNRGRFTYINKRGAEAHGLKPADLRGKTLAEIFGAGVSQIAVDAAAQVIKTGAALFDVEFNSSQFLDRIHSYNFAPVFDGGGDVIGVVSAGQDITERRRSETILSENERALAQAQRIGLMGHWRIYPDSGRAELSDQICQVVGIEEGDNEHSLKDLHGTVSHDDLTRMENARATALANREPYSFKYRLTRPDGEVRVMAGEGQPEYDGAGNLVSVFGVTQDITDRDRVETKLRESEKRLTDFADASADFYWQTDDRLRFNYISPSLEQQIGIDAGHLIGKTLGDVTDPAFQEADAWQRVQRKMQMRQPFRDLVFERPNGISGESVWLSTSGKPYYDENGKFQGIRGSSTNITERRALEEQLIQAQKMEAVGQLTGGVAHDFNNLLAVIMGNAELLMSAPGKGGAIRKGRNPAEAILRAADRGAELTQQLLAFSRKQALSPKVIQLNMQLDGMISMLQRSLGETIRIDANGGNGLWPCLADPGQLENAVLNLAINARDAMPRGGTLSIETANARLDDVHAVAAADATPGEYVTLAVTDNGNGMSSEVRKRIFEPFFTTKEQGRGTGLGLSMVFGFVKQSNGHVTVKSEEGSGTTITLYLPRAPARPGIGTDIQTPPTESRGECILLVEDEAELRLLTVDFLESLDYRVLAAGNGVAALEILAREDQIDLLFTDVMLPGGMNGDAIARQACHQNPDIKVIFTSGYAPDALVREGQLQDGVILLHKPYSQADLAVKLRQVLEVRAPRGSAATTENAAAGS